MMFEDLRRRSEEILAPLSEGAIKNVGSKILADLREAKRALPLRLELVRLEKQKRALRVREEGDHLSEAELTELLQLLDKLETEEGEATAVGERLSSKIKTYSKYAVGRPRAPFELAERGW